MKQSLTLILLICPLFSHADEVIDSALIKVEYIAHSQTVLERYLGDDTYVLEIGKKSTCFYNLTKQNYNDALEVACGGDKSVAKFLNFYNSPNRPPIYNCGYDLYKNYPKGGVITRTDVIRREFFYICEDSVPQLEWEFMDGDTVIASYPCNKAVCEYRGRRWTAWYTLDIPYDDGPWKLGGLPGLILAASDAEGHFTFCCTKIEQGRKSPMLFRKGRYEKCTTKKLNKLKYEFWQDQRGFMSEQQGMRITGNYPGSTQKIFTYNPMERR